MPKITFMGAGSTVFVKNTIGDCMLTPSLTDAHYALYDIDGTRLRESKRIIQTMNRSLNKGRAHVTAHLGVKNRRAALRGADYVVNAIQVGGYEPSTVIDFEIPKRYGLRQTIGDTLGIGGIFRALRTIPVLQDFAKDIEAVCPDAWFLNYSNPMAMLTGAMLLGTGVKTVGLCHSVQTCAKRLLGRVGMLTDELEQHLQWKTAGINHQDWLLEISANGNDLYPEIKRRAARMNRAARKKGAEKHDDMVRFDIMLRFGYYVTESSEHSAEYLPYWIKKSHPDLIAEFRIPLDEYPKRCVRQIENWKILSKRLANDRKLTHTRSREYSAGIMDAGETDIPYRIGGNVLNHGLIPNLPAKACVEIPCLVDRNGVQGTYVGDLPEQCAALNRTNINVQLLTIEAALTRKKESIYHAAMLDPATGSQLTLDEIRRLCNDLIKAHGTMMPTYR